MPVTLVIAVKTVWSSFYTVHYHIVFVDFEDIFHAWIFRSLFWRVSVVSPLIAVSVCVCDAVLRWSVLTTEATDTVVVFSSHFCGCFNATAFSRPKCRTVPICSTRYAAQTLLSPRQWLVTERDRAATGSFIFTDGDKHCVKAFLRFLRCPSHKDVATFLLTTSTILQSSSSWRPTTPAEHIRPTSLLCRWPVCLELSTGRAPGSGH